MSNRDPKTGRFIQAWKLKERELKDEGYLVLSDLDKISKKSFDQIYENILNEQKASNIAYTNDHITDALTHGISFQKIKYEDVYKTKTPTNYWNYILVGVLGVVMLVVGYELHELLPIP